MRQSETFGVEAGHGKEVVDWINKQAEDSKGKFEARLYNQVISTNNFGNFEMFSWIGDVHLARKLVLKASKRFKVKVIEGGYKPKERVFRLKNFDYAFVRKGEKVIGRLEFEAGPLGLGQWKLKTEERR